MSYIYILSNDAMPGLVKIGRTTNSPDIRANELYTTGVPCRFEIEHFWRVPDRRLDAIEKELHRLLHPYRFNSKREFFEIDPTDAVECINKHLGNSGGKTFEGNLDRLLFAVTVFSILGLLLAEILRT